MPASCVATALRINEQYYVVVSTSLEAIWEKGDRGRQTMAVINKRNWK